eukprot:m.294963 g.294963  ORF g.294963 m.294963 type:complete len:265 (+) comp20036_c0_seq34:187-981(+)
MASKLKSIYELNRVLGEGTFGKVYHGVDKSDQSEWAIKICKERYTKFEDCVLLPEVRSLIKLKKEATGKYGDSGFPHIILLRELIREKCGTLSLVFEFAHGQDLGWIVDNTSKPFTTNHVNFLAKQLFRGLAFMHRWYFHRDLKPENLMCSKDNCVLKIIDFGQARARRSKPPYTDYCGTRWYRAPELQLSGQVYGTPVDLWSAGRHLGRCTYDAVPRRENALLWCPADWPYDSCPIVAVLLRYGTGSCYVVLGAYICASEFAM